jgi:general secretion pathway protein G
MRHRNGFTLVELVVVIMILGILAGVAAPRMLNTAGSATDNGLRQTLAIVRDAIELYAASPTNPSPGSLPPCTGTGADFRTAVEPFLRGNFPACPVGATAGTATAIDVKPMTEATASDETSGWRYDTTTGAFSANCGDTCVSISGTTYDAL